MTGRRAIKSLAHCRDRLTGCTACAIRHTLSAKARGEFGKAARWLRRGRLGTPNPTSSEALRLTISDWTVAALLPADALAPFKLRRKIALSETREEWSADLRWQSNAYGEGASHEAAPLWHGAASAGCQTGHSAPGAPKALTLRRREDERVLGVACGVSGATARYVRLWAVNAPRRRLDLFGDRALALRQTD